jgi:tetratricopeptide (TPR) repeat protein
MVQARSIIELNAYAVHLICDRKYQRAGMVLAKALHRLRAQFSQTREVTNEFQQKSDNTTHSLREENVVRSIYVPQNDLMDDSFVFSVYNRALLITGSDLQVIYSCHNEATVSGVLLYNMALSHHLQGLYCESESLEKALRLYEAANSILSLNRSFCCADRLVFLGIWNNKGAIYSMRHQNREAQECLDEVKLGLETVISQDLHGDLSEISLNVTLLHGKMANAPAA